MDSPSGAPGGIALRPGQRRWGTPLVSWSVIRECEVLSGGWWNRPHCRPFERRLEMQYRILIVDDSKLARMVMVSAFRRIRPEWELVEAADADEALKAISSNSVDIALVDFNMPGTDGLELVDRIREINPTMPVAVVSAN